MIQDDTVYHISHTRIALMLTRRRAFLCAPIVEAIAQCAEAQSSSHGLDILSREAFDDFRPRQTRPPIRPHNFSAGSRSGQWPAFRKRLAAPTTLIEHEHGTDEGGPARFRFRASVPSPLGTARYRLYLPPRDFAFASLTPPRCARPLKYRWRKLHLAIGLGRHAARHEEPHLLAFIDARRCFLDCTPRHSL